MECDKACHFCFLDLDGRTLSIERFAEMLDSNEFDRATISGGEPFTDNRIFDFLIEAYERNIAANIITNGNFLDELTVDRLIPFEDLNLYVSYHSHNPALRNNMKLAANKGISVHAHVILETKTYQNIETIISDMGFVDSMMVLFPTNTGGESRIKMHSADTWYEMLSKVMDLTSEASIDLFYEPAFARRDISDTEAIICPAGEDPFLHVDGKNYPCCLLVDTEYGVDNLSPQGFDYRKCPILNVPQSIETAEYRRICPLLFTKKGSDSYVFPNRIKEL